MLEGSLSPFAFNRNITGLRGNQALAELKSISGVTAEDQILRRKFLPLLCQPSEDYTPAMVFQGSISQARTSSHTACYAVLGGLWVFTPTQSLSELIWISTLNPEASSVLPYFCLRWYDCLTQPQTTFTAATTSVLLAKTQDYVLLFWRMLQLHGEFTPKE